MLHMFWCGKFGHKKENCVEFLGENKGEHLVTQLPPKPTEVVGGEGAMRVIDISLMVPNQGVIICNNVVTAQNQQKINCTQVNNEEGGDYGPWLTVKRNSRKKRVNGGTGSVSNSKQK